MKCLNLNTVALRGKYPARRKKGGPKQYKGRDGDKRGRHFLQAISYCLGLQSPPISLTSELCRAISVHFLLDFMTRLCSMFFPEGP